MRISDLLRLGKEALVFAIIFVIAFMVVWFVGYKLIYKKIMRREGNLSIKKAIPYGFVMVVVLVILYATILRGSYWNGNPSLLPFSSYKSAWYSFSYSEWRNLILNICMFVPFGFIMPIAFKRLRKAWKTYLAGFAFTVLIETLQLILKRGIFETDDLINNLLDTMIGYGLFAIVFAVKEKKTIKNVLFLQIPLLVTVISFAFIFISYNKQELGNMILEDVSKHEMPTINISSDIELSTEEAVCNIYQMKVATIEDTRKFAEKFFLQYEKEIDEERTDIYEETAIHYSEDGGQSLWIDYKGLKVWFTNFDLLFSHDGESVEYLVGAEKEEIKKAIENIGFFIPEDASFEELGRGEYSFEVTGEVIDGTYCTGKASCRLNLQGEVLEMHYDIITGEKSKQVSVISSQKAFDTLCSGEFYYPFDEISTESELMVESMQLMYAEDSKGFYQPIYRFDLVNEKGEQLQIDIVAREK